MSDTLKPCQCGNKELIIKKYLPQENEVYTYFSPRYAVSCLYTGNDIGCGAESGHYKSQEEAIAVWNNRPIEDELTAENTRLKETVTRLNRRCQLAESAVNDCMKIKEGNIHAFSIGRGLLAYDLDNERRENEKLTARIAELEAEDHPRTLTSLKWRKIKN